MPIKVPCASCGALLDRRPSQITPTYKAFCNKAHESAYKNTPEGKAWMESWQKPCTQYLPHYRKKEVIEIDN